MFALTSNLQLKGRVKPIILPVCRLGVRGGFGPWATIDGFGSLDTDLVKRNRSFFDSDPNLHFGAPRLVPKGDINQSNLGRPNWVQNGFPRMGFTRWDQPINASLLMARRPPILQGLVAAQAATKSARNPYETHYSG